MEIEIIEKKENPLLGRTEVKFKAAFMGATPSRGEVRKKLTAILNSNKELTVLDKFENAYGSTTALGYAKVYKDIKALKLEPEYLIKRNKDADEKIAAKKAEAKAEDKAPVEEVKVDKAPLEEASVDVKSD